MKTTDILVIAAVMVVLYFAFSRTSSDENDEELDESLDDDSGFGWGRPAGGHTKRYLQRLWECKDNCSNLPNRFRRKCRRTCNCRHGNPLRCCTKHCIQDNRGPQARLKRKRCIRKCQNGKII